jgi:hypothetical protein
VEADFHVACATSDDANQLGSLLNAGFLLLKMQATSQNNSGLVQLVDGAKVTSAGEHLSVSINLTNDQVVTLIQSKALALKM